MKSVQHGSRARIATVGIIAAGGLLLAGCGAANETAAPAAGGGQSGTALSGSISGAGASSQQAAVQAWVAGFNGANPGATINYDPSGSGAGRTQFLGGGVDFAGSDSALKEDEVAKAKTRCNGDIVEVPVYVSPIAVVYNLPGVTNLQLTPQLLAQIFQRKITTWNDPAIAAVNPGVNLPATPITAVNRSDKSGTTQNFADYLSKAAPQDWTAAVSDEWPFPGGEAAQGTSGVIGAVKAGAGTIGYADESQAGDLGKVKVAVGTGYVEPNATSAAKILEASERVTTGGQYSFAYKVARTTTDATAYPIVLVSYFITCAKQADPAKAALVKGYLQYVVSPEGQTASAESAGSAPLSDAIRTAITPAVTAIA